MTEIRSAVGRFDDVAEVVGTKRPDAGGCWCMSYRDARVPNLERPGYLRGECAADPGPGVLAHVDDRVAGWCSIAPRSTYRRLMRSRTITFLDDRAAWGAVYFVVRPSFRGRGLMHDLLDGAVAHAAEHGAQLVECYPIESAGTKVDVISGYVGTVELFGAHAFHRAGPTTAHSGHRDRWIMRRDLSAV